MQRVNKKIYSEQIKKYTASKKNIYSEQRKKLCNKWRTTNEEGDNEHQGCNKLFGEERGEDTNQMNVQRD